MLFQLPTNRRCTGIEHSIDSKFKKNVLVLARVYSALFVGETDAQLWGANPFQHPGPGVLPGEACLDVSRCCLPCQSDYIPHLQI